METDANSSEDIVLSFDESALTVLGDFGRGGGVRVGGGFDIAVRGVSGTSMSGVGVGTGGGLKGSPAEGVDVLAGPHGGGRRRMPMKSRWCLLGGPESLNLGGPQKSLCNIKKLAKGLYNLTQLLPPKKIPRICTAHTIAQAVRHRLMPDISRH